MPTLGKPWFARKRFGYGAGLPLTWQGWALLVGFLAAVFLVSQFLREPARIVAITALVVVFTPLALLKTEPPGGDRRA